MKSIIIAAIFAVSVPAFAQTADQSFAELLSAKLKETRPVVLLGPYTKPAYSAFLPVWTFHGAYEDGKADPRRDYLEMGLGGKYETGSKSADAFVGTGLNIIALSGKVWSFAWAESHVRRSVFPPIFLGPSLTLPVEWRKYEQTNAGEFFKANARVMASVILKW